MNVAENKVVSFHYTLTSKEGVKLESSREGDAMSYLHGAGNIIPGLEDAMSGRVAGDIYSVTIPPEQAYGVRSAANIQRIPLKRLGKNFKARPGQVLNLQTNQGPVQVTVVKVGKFNIDVDANHPLSGATLTFEVEITEVRDATEEEISHGHVHGPGAHDHD